MSTATGTYFDGQVARGRAVSIEFLENSLLRISGEDFTREVELAHIRVSDRLGDVPRFLYLPDDAIIETPDNAIVDAALGERQQSRGSRLIHALESQQRIAAIGCVLIVAAIAALGFYGPPVLARLVAQRVPMDIDQRIGTAALATIRPYFRESSLGAAEQKRVQQQLARLQTDPSVPRPRIEFRSMNGGLPNAFALPGNVIIVTDELIRLPASDDEIAAVLAHELGHLQKRHGLQSLLRSSFAVMIVAAVTGDLSALTSFAGTIPLTILTAGYSRDLEHEADLYALDLLRARGIKPRAFVTVLVKLEASHDTLQRNSTYLSTHPATDERTALFGGITAPERQAVLADGPRDRATDALDRRDFETALVECNRLITLAPTAAAYVLRAKSQQGRKDFSAAEADIAKAIELDPKSIEARVLSAEVFALDTRKFPEAITAARRALALDPKNSTATAFLGYAEFMQGDPKAAALDLDHAIELGRSDFHGWAYRGYLRERTSDHAGANADYTEAIKLAPNIEWIRFNRGWVRSRLRDYTAALADFNAMTDQPHQPAGYFYERGLAEQATGQNDLAIADYGRALEKKPDKSIVAYLHLNRGIVFAAKNSFYSAIVDFDAAIDKDPKLGAAYLQRAVARRHSGDAANAPADLDRAAQAGIDEQLVQRERAEVEWELGHYAEALRQFDTMLAKNPDAFVFEARGLLEFSQGQWKKAEEDFNAYFAWTKPRPEEYVEFFRLLARRGGHADDHQDAFATVIETWPDNWAKSVGRYLSGQTTEEQLLMDTDRGKTPNHNERRCEAYFYIGFTHLLAHDPAGAEAFFKKCTGTGIQNYHEFRLARDELRRLHENH